MQPLRFKWTVIAIVATAFLIWTGTVAQSSLRRAGATQPDMDQVTTVSATGTGQVAVSLEPAPFMPSTLSIEIQGRVRGNELQAAVEAVETTAASIKADLLKAGVGAENMQRNDFSVSAEFGSPPPPPTPGKPALFEPPPFQSYSVRRILQVDTSELEQLLAAAQIAAQPGVSAVRTWVREPQRLFPDPSTLSPAIMQATEQADAMARESAKASGLSLGSIRSVSVRPAEFYSTSPNRGFWRVQVTVIYNVVPSQPR